LGLDEQGYESVRHAVRTENVDIEKFEHLSHFPGIEHSQFPDSGGVDQALKPVTTIDNLF